MRLVAEATALVFGFSYLVRPAEAALATTCYIELSSKLFIAGSDFACGVVNDTSVGGSYRRMDFSTGTNKGVGAFNLLFCGGYLSWA
jgi:hypothetical protein